METIALTRRHPARTVLAALAVVALIAGAVGLLANRRRPAPRLVLVPAGRAPERAVPASAGADPGAVPYRFRLAISAPSLGSTAPVGRLHPPAVDAARVRSMAAALGLHGAVRSETGGGWQVADGSRQLTITPTPGGWAVSESEVAVAVGPGHVPSSVTGSVGVAGPAGSAGPVGSAGSGGASGGSTRLPLKPGPPPVPLEPPQPPANLPGPTEAEQIARELLARMGITGDWSATVGVTTAGGVACAPQPCATPNFMVVTSRSVELRPRFRGTVIDGLAWHIEIGSNGTITGVSGPWTNLRTIATYPLRSVTAVFADLRAGRGIDPEPVATGAPAPAPGEAVPFHEIAPVTVTIDHVTLGAAVIPATDGRNAVVDIVPTYVFSGHAGADVIVSRTLVAVDANVTTPPGR